MSWQLSHGHLIGSFLELQYLLVDELTFLMHDIVWIQRTRIRLILGRSFPGTCPWQRDARYTSGDRDGFRIVTISALYTQSCRFGRERRCTDDDARYADEMRDVCGVKISYGYLGDRGVEE